MAKYDVVIIGSGLGGLLCGYILSKEGLKVCIIEKHHQIGGCLQTFNRKGCEFDTGVHYVGGLDKGGNLYTYFKYFDLIDNIKMRKLDHIFDVISFYDEEYHYATGHENFVETLAKKFPDQRENLKNYIHKIKNLSSKFPLYNLREVSPGIVESQFFSENAAEYIESEITNPRLQNVLAGTNLLYAGVKDKTPLYVHSLINNSNIEGAWRFVDGSAQIADHLSNSILSNGGKIFTSTEAKHFEFRDNLISALELTNGERLEADRFISSIHPAKTLEMVDEHRIRDAYRMRIDTLDNTISTFVMYIVLKKNSFKYLNHNIYYYDQDNVWNAGTYKKDKWPATYMMLTPAISASEEYADSMFIMTYMHYDDVKKWENTTIEKRGAEYREFKHQRAERILDVAEKRIPDIRSHIDTYYTSTPLTYRDYTGTKYGSLYGILKDSSNPLKTMILPKTKIPNLYLTGQNTNLHGVLGVTVGAVLTCAEFLEINYLMKKILEAS